MYGDFRHLLSLEATGSTDELQGQGANQKSHVNSRETGDPHAQGLYQASKASNATLRTGIIRLDPKGWPKKYGTGN
jgi:hypothetical protein